MFYDNTYYGSSHSHSHIYKHKRHTQQIQYFYYPLTLRYYENADVHIYTCISKGEKSKEREK